MDVIKCSWVKFKLTQFKCTKFQNYRIRKDNIHITQTINRSTVVWTGYFLQKQKICCIHVYLFFFLIFLSIFFSLPWPMWRLLLMSLKWLSVRIIVKIQLHVTQHVVFFHLVLRWFPWYVLSVLQEDNFVHDFSLIHSAQNSFICNYQFLSSILCMILSFLFSDNHEHKHIRRLFPDLHYSYIAPG